MLKKGKRVLVRSAHWTRASVDAPEVAQFVPAIAARRASAGLLVTEGLFTTAARELARQYGVGLLDGTRLHAPVATSAYPAVPAHAAPVYAVTAPATARTPQVSPIAATAKPWRPPTPAQRAEFAPTEPMDDSVRQRFAQALQARGAVPRADFAPTEPMPAHSPEAQALRRQPRQG